MVGYGWFIKVAFEDLMFVKVVSSSKFWMEHDGTSTSDTCNSVMFQTTNQTFSMGQVFVPVPKDGNLCFELFHGRRLDLMDFVAWV